MKFSEGGSLHSEQKEAVEAPNIIIDLIRHGQPAYLINTYQGGSAGEVQEHEFADFKYPFSQKLVNKNGDAQLPINPAYSNEYMERVWREGKLTSKGIEQAERVADHLIGIINRDKELVILLSSPITRATETASVIWACLKDAGIDFLDVRTFRGLEHLQYGGWNSFMRANRQKGSTAELYPRWRKGEGDFGDFETYPQISQRINQDLLLVQNLVATQEFSQRYPGKTIRILAVGHGELFDPVIRETGFELPDTTSMPPGSLLEISVPGSSDDASEVDLRYIDVAQQKTETKVLKKAEYLSQITNSAYSKAEER